MSSKGVTKGLQNLQNLPFSRALLTLSCGSRSGSQNQKMRGSQIPPRTASTFSTSQIHRSSRQDARVAVLYQAVEPPVVNGVKKPMKPGGYRDSGADIAYVLQQNGTDVITSQSQPDPEADEGWCFPDTERGVLSALEKGATHLWANTILFATHPLQNSSSLDKYANDIKVIGQPPQLVEQYDDKNYVNSLLRKDESLTLPKSWIVGSTSDVDLSSLPYPIVGKPIRGRGSHGVKVCRSVQELGDHLKQILSESPIVMLEEFLSGQEGTITVMPPSEEKPYYWSMPIVVRFNHEDGIAPYNGVVAVTGNSRLVSEEELQSTDAYNEICKECVRVAERLKVTAPIRVDVRRINKDPDARFALFDVNMKPNMTGPGRPGRENQASLTAMAAKALGYDYPGLLQLMLSSAQSLQHLREQQIS